MKIAPKSWREFQHYKDRSPPWIRLHRKLLDNKDFQRLPVASRALAPMLWLLASESVDGVIDGDLDDLAFRLRSTVKEIGAALKPLIEKGFFVVVHGASTPIAACVHDAVPETETETETERTPAGRPAEGFPEFYAAYPRKVKPKDARKAWDKLKPNAELRAVILKAIDAQRRTEQWQKDGGQFIPYPATWLNSESWLNETQVETFEAGNDSLEASNEYLREQAEHAAKASKPPAELLSMVRRSVKDAA